MNYERTSRGRALLAALGALAIGCSPASKDEGTSTEGDPVTGGQPGGNTATPGGGAGAQPGGGGQPGTASPGGGGQPGGVQGGDGGDGDNWMLSADDTFLRADALVLEAPDLVVKPFGLEQAITAQAQDAVDNALTQDNEPDDGDSIPEDSDGDGYVDLSLLVRFLGKVDPSAAGGMTTVGGAFCPHPYDSSQVCGPLNLAPFQDPLAFTHGSDCALDGTDKVAAGSCFVTEKGPVTVNVQLVGQVPLEDGQVIGSWVDNGAGGIVNGWVRGFLSEAVAKTTKLPAQLPLAAVLLQIKPNTPLIEFLPGRQKTENGQGVPGWWFLLSYTAKPAVFDATVGPDGVTAP